MQHKIGNIMWNLVKMVFVLILRHFMDLQLMRMAMVS